MRRMRLQATFLILVRRAATVRRQDSIGSWLHGVALRVAGCARGSTARRRARERRAAELAPTECSDIRSEVDLAPVLHEELGRLPERYRGVIVLCYLEGLSCEEAAGRLGWPVGTVKSRLARGRERLRVRLIHRGLAPSAGLLAMVLSTEAEAVAIKLPTLLVESTARSATFFAAGQAPSLGVIPASVAALTRRMLILMFLNKLTIAVAMVLSLAAASMTIVALAEGTSGQPREARAQRARVVPAKTIEKDETPVPPEPVLENAIRAADQITVPWMKAQALADLAAAQARLGQVEPARATFRRVGQIIEGLGDDGFPAATLSWLAQAQATAGDRASTQAIVAQFLDCAAKIANDDSRQRLLLIAAMRQGKAGDPQGAMKVVEALNGAPASLPRLRPGRDRGSAGQVG